MPGKIKGARLRGASVELSRIVTADGEGTSPWNVIAYEVELKSRRAKLARKDFADVVKNFARYPRVPVVLMHADTDPGGHPDSAKARGWIQELRVGEMERKGKKIATLEARMALDEQTRADINKDPPAWALCSVTIVQNAMDEESAENLGTVLYSLSLTNNPALQDLPRLAASAEFASEEDGDETARKGTPMKWLAMAAKLNIAAASEEEAEVKIIALGENIVDVRKALNLAASAGPAEIAARVVELAAEAAKVATLMTELSALRATEEQRAAKDRAEHLADVIAAKPELEGAKDALELMAKVDFAHFSKKYPRPSRMELSQRAQDVQRFARETPVERERVMELNANNEPNAGEIAQAATAICEKYGVTFSEALAMLQGNASDATAASAE